MSASKLSSSALGAAFSGFTGGVLGGVVAGPDAGVWGDADGGFDVLGDVVLGAVVFDVVPGGVVLDVVLGAVVFGVVFCDGVLSGASSIEPLQPSASVLAASQATRNVVRSRIEGRGRWDCRLKGTSRSAMVEIVYRPRPGFVPVRLLRGRPGPCRLRWTCAGSVPPSCRSVRRTGSRATRTLVLQSLSVVGRPARPTPSSRRATHARGQQS